MAAAAGGPVTSSGSFALAPLGLGAVAAGGDTTSSGSFALAPLAMQATGAGGDIPGAPPVALLPVLPQIIVEAGLIPDSPTQASTALRLDDPVFGLLDTGTLGTSITWTDISQWVISFTMTRPSTRLQGPLWTYQAGTISILLDNATGQFDPDNLAGPYISAGLTQLVAMVPVRLRTNFAAQAYQNYSGFADGWLPGAVTYEGGYAEITLPASDAFKVLAGITLPAASIEGVSADTGARVADILGRAGWYTSAERRAINTGNSLLQGTTLGTDALSLMRIATDSEIGQLYVNGAGAVVFRSRQALLTDTRSNTVQAVFGDLGSPFSLLWQVQWNGNGVTANPGAQSQLISGVVPLASYRAPAVFFSPQGWPSAQLAVNWFDAGGTYISTGAGPAFNVPAGAATLVTTGPLTAPAGAAKYTVVPQMTGTPASSVVMTAAWNHAGAATALTGYTGPWTWTASNSSTVTSPGPVPAAWYPVELPYAAVTRASDDTTIANDVQATRVGGTLQEVKDAASVSKYLFPRTYARTDLILQNDSDALAWAQWVLYIARGGEDRFESLQIDPQADPYNLWPQVLGREIGDRIQVVNRPAGVASPIVKDCFIAGITHVWDSIASTWLTTWTLQDASKYGAFLTLDNPVLGRLDANALAY
jgi:hypothetical protein